MALEHLPECGRIGKGPRGGRAGRRDPVPAVTSLLSPFREEGESPDLRGAAEVW